MRIYLDDLREPPIFDRLTGEEIKWDAICRTAEAAIALINSGQVSFISFDHDLGGALSGYDVALHIEKLAESKQIKALDYAIHSGNPVGSGNIDKAMKSAIRFWNQLDKYDEAILEMNKLFENGTDKEIYNAWNLPTTGNILFRQTVCGCCPSQIKAGEADNTDVFGDFVCKIKAIEQLPLPPFEYRECLNGNTELDKNESLKISANEMRQWNLQAFAKAQRLNDEYKMEMEKEKENSCV